MTTEYMNAVYYPSWEVYQGKGPSSLQVQNITHVLYAFLLVERDGSLQLSDKWADTEKEVDGEKGCIRALAKLKQHHPHIKTLVSVGGGRGSAEFPALAADTSARERFANAISHFVCEHQFDGVDSEYLHVFLDNGVTSSPATVDWEHPSSAEQGEHYVKMLSALRQVLPSPQYLLTTALPAGTYCLQHVDLAATAGVVDYINLMGYDFTGNWTDVSGHHAQLFPLSDDRCHQDPTLKKCSSTAVEYLTSQGFPSCKIVRGIPVYARNFCQSNEPGQHYSEAGEIDYCDLPAEWVCEARSHESVGAASYVDEGGKGFVSFDSVSTARQKANYVKEKGLGGLFYWHGCGDRHGEESLVAAGKDELHRSS